MSEDTRNKIRMLFNSMNARATLVQERMRQAGMEPDPLVADSIAKYWDALEKLAAE